MAEQIQLDLNAFKKESLTTISVMLALGLVTLALGPLTGGYRGFYLCLTLGLIITVSSAIYLVVIYTKTTTLKSLAVPTIQSLWISTSMGLGYVVTAYAPYFEINFPVATALFVIGWIMLIFGAFKLLTISRKTGIQLAV